MQPKGIFIGNVFKGKLNLGQKKIFTDYLRSLEYKDKPAKIILTVKRWRKKRTTGAEGDKSNQNGYMFGVMLPLLCDHHGYTPLEMYHALEFHFCRIGGTDTLPKIKELKTLNTVEWEDTMEKIRIWALTDYEINIPVPESIEGINE
jgi:hypothetical protein